MSEREGHQIEFAIFCIENIAEALGVSGDVAYRKLAVESDILQNYILKHFEILHILRALRTESRFAIL